MSTAPGPPQRGPSFANPVAAPREGLVTTPVTLREKLAAAGATLRPGRDDLVDLAFAAVLVAIALAGFRTGFHGWAWVAAGAAGLLLGLLVAHAVSAFRLPAVVGLLAVAVVYFLLGGPLAVRDSLIGGVLPSGQTFRDLGGTLVHGWKRFLTMLPPVDSVGPLVALPFLVGLVGAAVVYAVARRWSRPYAVAVAPLALLALSISFGTLEPASVLAQGMLFGLALIGWMITRAARNRAPLQNGAGHRTRFGIGVALLTVAALAAYLVGPHLPGADADSRTVARTALVPPFDVAQFPSPLAGFRKYTEPNPAKLWDQELLKVDGLPADFPLRFATLDSYDDAVWGAGDRANAGSGREGAPFQQVGSQVATEADGRPVEVSVTVPEGGYVDPWLPTAGTVTGVHFEGARAETLAKRLWLNVDTNTAIVPDKVRPGDRYTLDVVLPSLPSKLPASLPVASGSLVEDVDLGFLDARIDAWSNGAGDSWAQLLAVARDMQNQGTYTDGGTKNSVERVYLPGHSRGRLGRFVGSTQLAGNDEQYASTLALAANRLGIPARPVLGAIVPASGLVTGKDVHAWVEVQAADGAWVALLPKDFMPDRSKKPNQQRLRTEEQKVGAVVPPPAGVNPPSVLQGPDQAQNATNLKKPPKKLLDPSSWPTWLRWLIFYVLIPLLTLALLYGLIRGLKAHRRRRHATRGSATARIAWAWEDLVLTARSYGLHPPHRATRLEQSTALGERGATLPLAATANALVFGPGEPSTEEAAAYWSATRESGRELRAHADAWRRLRADVDVRPLFAGGPQKDSPTRAFRLLPIRRAAAQ